MNKRPIKSRVSLWLKSMLEEVNIAPKDRKGKKGYNGRTTKLPMNRWMAAVFEINEFRAIQFSMDQAKKPLTDPQIKYNWSQEFERYSHVQLRSGREWLPGGSIASGKWGIGMLRNRYRKRQLFKYMLPPIFMSFKYSPEGHILKDGVSKSKFLTFSECQELCIQFKIADPRFFKLEEMERIHQFTLQKNIYDQWSIPTKEMMDELSKEFPFDLYRSVKTYDIWKKEPIASDYSPPNQIQEEIEAQESESRQAHH